MLHDHGNGTLALYLQNSPTPMIREKLAINMNARSQHKKPHLHKRGSSVVKTFMNECDPRFRYWFDWMCLPSAHSKSEINESAVNELHTLATVPSG